MLGVSMWKATDWNAKYDTDHAAFGAGIKNAVDYVNHLAHSDPEAPSTLPAILLLVAAGNEKEEENSDVDISEEDCATHGNITSNCQWECVWPNCLLCGM